MVVPGGAAVCRVPARVGLVGNPSDGYGGAVLGTVVPGLAATVTAESSDGVEFCAAAMIERWPSTCAWQHHVDHLGHVGEQRVIGAALWALADHIRSVRGVAADRGVRLTWSTKIPRSVGLGGSSALAIGVIDATAELWDVPLDRRVVAALALATERDLLGIDAGWQDRIIQSFRTTVLVDAGTMVVVDHLAVPTVSVVAGLVGEDRSSIPLLVGWHASAATSSDDYHGPLRAMASSLVAPMEALAGLARRAADALRLGDVAELARAVDQGWLVRQASAPLRTDHARLVEIVRSTGLAATTPGSGGAVVAICPDEHSAERAIRALVNAGCGWQRFEI